MYISNYQVVVKTIHTCSELPTKSTACYVVYVVNVVVPGLAVYKIYMMWSKALGSVLWTL